MNKAENISSKNAEYTATKDGKIIEFASSKEKPSEDEIKLDVFNSTNSGNRPKLIPDCLVEPNGSLVEKMFPTKNVMARSENVGPVCAFEVKYRNKHHFTTKLTKPIEDIKRNQENNRNTSSEPIEHFPHAKGKMFNENIHETHSNAKCHEENRDSLLDNKFHLVPISKEKINPVGVGTVKSQNKTSDAKSCEEKLTNSSKDIQGSRELNRIISSAPALGGHFSPANDKVFNGDVECYIPKLDILQQTKENGINADEVPIFRENKDHAYASKVKSQKIKHDEKYQLSEMLMKIKEQVKEDKESNIASETSGLTNEKIHASDNKQEVCTPYLQNLLSEPVLIKLSLLRQGHPPVEIPAKLIHTANVAHSKVILTQETKVAAFHNKEEKYCSKESVKKHPVEQSASTLKVKYIEERNGDSKKVLPQSAELTKKGTLSQIVEDLSENTIQLAKDHSYDPSQETQKKTRFLENKQKTESPKAHKTTRLSTPSEEVTKNAHFYETPLEEKNSEKNQTDALNWIPLHMLADVSSSKSKLEVKSQCIRNDHLYSPKIDVKNGISSGKDDTLPKHTEYDVSQSLNLLAEFDFSTEIPLYMLAEVCSTKPKLEVEQSQCIRNDRLPLRKTDVPKETSFVKNDILTKDTDYDVWQSLNLLAEVGSYAQSLPTQSTFEKDPEAGIIETKKLDLEDTENQTHIYRTP